METLAFERVREPQGNRGSDALLSHILNAHRPEKWKPELKREESNTRAILAALQQLATKDLRALPSAKVIEGEVIEVSDGEPAV